ncbi:MAG: GNAT family N-acetyltransferase [Candidatus Accumulibacter phosphatis]|uniref:GNAT family N-acetyltransferase n=1 Tax=Candidatus Accumulibacter sp. ACC012 TaxID=2823332 RepID=UPI0025BF235E|nr:GNAT family N-acetyltransferase [Candidatus Accumulibacter sp. ACC012]
MSSPSFNDTDVVLRDGRAVHLRAMHCSDEGELLQFFERLDPETRYMRFMHVVRKPDVKRLRRVLAFIPERGTGIVATIPADDGIDIVGGSSLMIGQDPANCEFAVTVTAAYARTGLGHTLMSALIAAAKARGLVEMEGFVLRANTAMLRLANRLGFTTSADPEDFSVVICRLRLDAPVDRLAQA